MATRTSRRQQQHQHQQPSQTPHEAVAPNWFHTIFQQNNKDNDNPTELEAMFYDCLRTARYPKDIRDALQLAVRTLEARHAVKGSASTQRGAFQSTASKHPLDDPAFFFSELVTLFWPMEMPYRETPFFRSAWSATSSELTKFCLALWILYIPLDHSSTRRRGFDTANVSVCSLASQVGLDPLIEQMLDDLHEAEESSVWPFHVLLASRHSLQDLADYCLLYLAPYPALAQHARSVALGWRVRSWGVSDDESDEQNVEAAESRDNVSSMATVWPEDMVAENKENAGVPSPTALRTGGLETIREESICSKGSSAASSLDAKEILRERADTDQSTNSLY